MSREQRKLYYSRGRDDYRSANYEKHRSASDRRSPKHDRARDKQRSRSPAKRDKEPTDDESILQEISKLPEPNELWETQFQDPTFIAPPQPPPPPSFGQQNRNYSTPSYEYTGIYDEFPSIPPAPQPPDIAWNQLSLPSAPAAQTSNSFQLNVEDQIKKKEAAIESEMRHQKAALCKQREDYIKKTATLKKELDTLKDQRNELRGDSKRSPSPDTKRFLKENTKLQLEIQNKLKTINNVVDMLNGIIGEEAMQVNKAEDKTEQRPAKRKSRSPTRFNYVYYDPEMHWCRICNEFPTTAKEYLNHLHSQTHQKTAAAHMEAPWHSVGGVNEGFPSYPSAPNKRTPIRGLQFFVPSTAWYCKLCDQFIGDLHCASSHLKSVMHSKNYSNFVEQNPHWETDWMSDRQKAVEKRVNKGKQEEKPQYAAHTITFSKDGFHTKRKKSTSPTSPSPEKKEKKRKGKKESRKRKKSSSSDSSTSDRTTEREAVKNKKSRRPKDSKVVDDEMLSEWMSSIHKDRLSDSDRKLLDSLKARMKNTAERNEEERSRATQRDHTAAEQHKKPREREGERREERGGERREARGKDRRGASTNKPDVKKMPFIGKMPVYKSMIKNVGKSEDHKKGVKKVAIEEVKKKREEVDAEIQKKVAEFREKITKAQCEREQALARAEMGPPGVALPTQLGTAVMSHLMTLPPPQPAPQPPPQPALQPPLQPEPPLQPQPQSQPPPQQQLQQTPQAREPEGLPKDFQEALDIIFPSSEACVQPLVLPPPFVSVSLPPMMVPPMYRPQLYDAHVPQVPPPHLVGHPQPNMQMHSQIHLQAHQQTHQQSHQQPHQQSHQQSHQQPHQQSHLSNGEAAKKREELDDMAMLGIDASDVGAGI